MVVLFRSLRVPTYHERWRALVMMLDGVSYRVMVNIMVYHAFFSEVVGGLVAVCVSTKSRKLPMRGCWMVW